MGWLYGRTTAWLLLLFTSGVPLEWANGCFGCMRSFTAGPMDGWYQTCGSFSPRGKWVADSPGECRPSGRTTARRHPLPAARYGMMKCTANGLLGCPEPGESCDHGARKFLSRLVLMEWRQGRSLRLIRILRNPLLSFSSPSSPRFLSLLLSSPVCIVVWVCRRVEQLALRPYLYVLLMLMSTREFQDFRCVARIRNL